MAQPGRGVLKLVKVIIVVLVLVAATSVLLPSLSHSRKQAIKSTLQELEQISSSTVRGGGRPRTAEGQPEKEPAAATPLAHVKTFVAEIDLTPRTSVGTATPESIYEARFQADITAVSPNGAQDCQVQLPLPPKIISLSDLEVAVNGEPTQDVVIDGSRLVWRGRLDEQAPAAMAITYTAVGKGMYTLEPPPGKIIETFQTRLTAHHTNIRMLDLSLQPDEPKHEGASVVYTWKFKNLMYGRPITLDVLGIAPVDRLGELSWLGPISVLAFGGLLALMILAYRPDRLDTWMLILVVGALAGAYPLMYFAQEFTSLPAGVLGASALVLAIIAARAVTLFGVRLGVLGVVGMAIVVLALTLLSTIYADYQGVLLTVGAIGVLSVAMALLPRAQKMFLADVSAPPPPTARPAAPDPRLP